MGTHEKHDPDLLATPSVRAEEDGQEISLGPRLVWVPEMVGSIQRALGEFITAAIERKTPLDFRLKFFYKTGGPVFLKPEEQNAALRMIHDWAKRNDIAIPAVRFRAGLEIDMNVKHIYGRSEERPY